MQALRQYHTHTKLFAFVQWLEVHAQRLPTKIERRLLLHELLVDVNLRSLDDVRTST